MESWILVVLPSKRQQSWIVSRRHPKDEDDDEHEDENF